MTRITVVIADDSIEIRELTRLTLDLDGRFEVVGLAQNGKEAVECVKSLRPDVIALDLAMPVMDGLTAIPNLLDASPGTKIVVVSGFAKSAMEDDVLAVGAHAYVQKGLGKPLAECLYEIASDRPSQRHVSSTPTATSPANVAVADDPPSLEEDNVYRTVVRALEESVFLLDRNGKVLASNESAERLFDLSEYALRGGPIPPEMRNVLRSDETPMPREETPVAVAFRTGAAQSSQVLGLQGPDGTTRWLSVNVRPVGRGDDGLPYAVVVSGVDISAQRAAEVAQAQAAQNLELANKALQESDEQRREFMNVTAHELGSPIAAIIAVTSTMLDRWEDVEEAKRRTFVEMVQRQAEMLSLLAEDLLTAARIDAGRLEVRPEVIDVRPAIEEAMETLSMQSADVKLNISGSLYLTGDRARFKQMVVNYTSNALKYGAPPVEIRASDTGTAVEVSVEDRGDGVPDHFRERLFDRFSRSNDLAVAGTGLGLFVVRKLAEAQGGAAWYEPGHPSGSRFVFSLPK